MKQTKVRQLNKRNWENILKGLNKPGLEDIEKVVREIVYPENK